MVYDHGQVDGGAAWAEVATHPEELQDFAKASRNLPEEFVVMAKASMRVIGIPSVCCGDCPDLNPLLIRRSREHGRDRRFIMQKKMDRIESK